MPKAKAKTKSAPKAKSKAQTKLAVPAHAGPRRLRGAEYKSFRLHKKIKPTLSPVAGSFRLFGRSLLVLKRHWRLFAGILLVYAVLNLLLVHGLASNGDLVTLKSAVQSTLHGSSGKVTSGLGLFVYLLGGSSSAGSSNANAGVYQTLLVIVVSLALIWGLRQVYSEHLTRVRESFYRGMYPLVPGILVLLVIILQLVPLLIGAFLYATVMGNGIAVLAIEKVLWTMLFILLALLSIYMICSSVFALYIVTLPDMTPMRALRSAREIVRHRRWLIVRKVLFLPLALVVLAAVIMVPAIIFVTVIAEWLYFVLTIVALAVIHSYMYALYRELLPHE